MYNSYATILCMSYLRTVFRDQDEAIVVYEITFNVLMEEKHEIFI